MKWLFVVLFLLQTHFAASYLAPLDQDARGAFNGLLRWFWPWAHGDSGPLGEVTEAGFPIAGFFLAVAAGSAFLLAALAVAGLWIPSGWWRVLAVAGAVMLVALMGLFFGPTKLIPIAIALGTLYVALANPGLVGR